VATRPRVALLSLPWPNLPEPSLGLGILRAQLVKAGVDVRVHHLHLRLLRYLKPTTYRLLAASWAVNDFVFGGALDPDVDDHQQQRLDEFIQAVDARGWLTKAGITSPTCLRELIHHLRADVIPRYLDDCAAAVLADDYTLVGMTCMFDQTIPSVALATKLRPRMAGATFALGGYAVANPADAMLLRAFDCIDVVARGDGEPIIVPLAEASAGLRAFADVPGITYRADDDICRTPTSTTWHIDESPTPDYDDFIRDVDRLERDEEIVVTKGTFPIEASRGCWWGEKSHCVFCGIDAETMRYRHKSPSRTLAMIDELCTRYPVERIRFNDYILPHTYHETLLPRLAQRKKVELECEVKANLSAEHVAGLRRAGFVAVQPGVESFSTTTLRRMQKGVTAAQNVLTLLLGRLHGIAINYNILFGFPQETVAELKELVERLPMLYHLDPPSSVTQVLVTRSAPLQTRPASFGVLGRQPPSSLYDVVFSREFLAASGFDWNAIAYYFNPGYHASDVAKRYHDIVALQAEHWQQEQRCRTPHLTYRIAANEIVFDDGRYSAEPSRASLGHVAATVYERCAGRIASKRDLLRPNGADETAFEAALDDLVRCRFIFRDGNRHVGLALPG
jgi:ribosomal peptide maturation radical SAM protein 1